MFIIYDLHLPSSEAQFIPNKQLQPKETQIYIKLVKYAMQALDIYQVEPISQLFWFEVGFRSESGCFPAQVQVANNQQTYIRVANCQTVRMKEEKEVLEHFAGVFTMMNPLTFKEIFQTTVPYMVERISKNYALQVRKSGVCVLLAGCSSDPLCSLFNSCFLDCGELFSSQCVDVGPVRHHFSGVSS